MISEARPANARESRELIPPDSPIFPWISVNPGRMHGVPVFKNTRVTVQSLFDYLQGGDSLEEFLDDFDGVTREQALAVLGLASEEMLARFRTR